MSQPVGPPDRKQYLEDLASASADLLRAEFPDGLAFAVHSGDDLHLGDIQLAQRRLEQAGLSRERAREFAWALYVLDAHGPELSPTDSQALPTPVQHFVNELISTHSAMVHRLRAKDPRRPAVDLFEIIANLADPLLRQRATELRLVGLDFIARWLQRLGHTLPEEICAKVILAFDAQSSIAERVKALQLLCDDRDSAASRPGSSVFLASSTSSGALEISTGASAPPAGEPTPPTLPINAIDADLPTDLTD